MTKTYIEIAAKILSSMAGDIFFKQNIDSC